MSSFERSSHPHRPWLTVILAMTADGKISDYRRSPARFGSSGDRAHLETQIAQTDAVLLGAGTLRAYGTSVSLSRPEQLGQRLDRGLAPQPVHIICSLSGELDPQLKFFRQGFPRWLLTSPQGAKPWQENYSQHFQLVLPLLPSAGATNWVQVLAQLKALGINYLGVLGGGQLLGSLLPWHCWDELWLTLCPYLLGGETAPNLIAGQGLLQQEAQNLTLLGVETQGNEVFLHYQCAS